jgi:hypothetical protein
MLIMSKKCLHHFDTFCYMYCELTFKSRRKNFTHLIKKYYRLYFGSKMCNHNKSWYPHICCVKGLRLLTRWVNASRQIPFGFPIVWNEPKDHSSYCYVLIKNYRKHLHIQSHNQTSRSAIHIVACST